jgi:hypothetical protein
MAVGDSGWVGVVLTIDDEGGGGTARGRLEGEIWCIISRRTRVNVRQYSTPFRRGQSVCREDVVGGYVARRSSRFKDRGLLETAGRDFQ